MKAVLQIAGLEWSVVMTAAGEIIDMRNTRSDGPERRRMGADRAISAFTGQQGPQGRRRSAGGVESQPLFDE